MPDTMTAREQPTQVTATAAAAPALFKRHWPDRGTGRSTNHVSSSGATNASDSDASTTATACDSHLTFGGKDEPVEHHGPTGHAPLARYLPRDGNAQPEHLPFTHATNRSNEGQASAVPAPASVGRHWAHTDSAGDLHYLADRVATRESHNASAVVDPASAPSAHYLAGNGVGKPEYLSVAHTTPQPHGRHVSDADPAPQPVILLADSIQQAKAALFTATLWQAITQAGGPHPTTPRHAHIAGLFDPAWITGLHLPTRDDIPEGQQVTLADDHFTRPDRETLAFEYQARRRTWIFERAHHTTPWLSLAAAYLGRLSGSRLEVLAAVFDSRAADHAPGAHWDQWYSAIVQFDGAKHWTIGTGPDRQHTTTTKGDVLLIPENLVHATTTPPDPGHSRHLAIGLCRHTEYTTATPNQP